MRICFMVTITWGFALALDVAIWSLFFSSHLSPLWISTMRIVSLR